MQKEFVRVLRALVTVRDGKTTPRSTPPSTFPTGSSQGQLVDALLDPDARQREGWLYVSTVIDLFSRRVVGWSMSAAMTAQLA